MRNKILIGLFLILLIILGYTGVSYYSFIFAKTIRGQVIAIDRVTQPSAIVGPGAQKIPDSQIFSFAVAIQNEDGEIFTASSEDRQWAVAEKGICVEAKFFPYPPWEFDKGNTYFGARLIKLYNCQGK